MADDYVFLITQIGEEGSTERRRSDDVLEGIVEPVASQFDMRTVRGDKVSSPGRITARIIRDLIGARVVVADLTGRNANVYYELGIAHTLQKPTILIIDSVDGLVFDAKDERVVAIGDDGQKIGVSEAKRAAATFKEFFEAVLEPDFVVDNLLTAATSGRALDSISAAGDPIAHEVVQLRDSVDNLATLVRVLSDSERYREPRWTLDDRHMIGATFPDSQPPSPAPWHRASLTVGGDLYLDLPLRFMLNRSGSGKHFYTRYPLPVELKDAHGTITVGESARLYEVKVRNSRTLDVLSESDDPTAEPEDGDE